MYNKERAAASEKEEAEKTPEAKLSDVLAAKESGEATDYDPYSERREKLGNFLKSKGLFTIDVVRVAAMTALKWTWSMIKIIGESITGKMSFKRGMDIAGEAFASDDKKGKK